MGKACTKHQPATFCESDQVAPGGVLINEPLDVLRLLSSNCLDDNGKELKPPHLLRPAVETLARSFQFFVVVYGIRLKHISHSPLSRDISRRSVLRGRASSGPAPQYFFTVDWDDGFLLRRTTPTKSESGQVSFKNSFAFFWSVDDLQRLGECKLSLRLYAFEHNRQPEHLGRVTLDILSVATGPVHNELPVFSHRGTRGSQHIIQDPSQTDYSGLRAFVRDARVQFDVRMSQVCELLVTPVEVIAHVEAAQAHASPPVANPTIVPSSPGPPPRSKSVAELDRVRTPTSEVQEATATPKQVEVGRRTAEDNDEGTKIERAAAGGHSAEDEKRPMLAKWQLDFVPTGVPNPSPFASAWTELTANPAWSITRDDPKDTPRDNPSSTKVGGDRTNLVTGPATAGSTTNGINVRRSLSHDVKELPNTLRLRDVRKQQSPGPELEAVSENMELRSGLLPSNNASSGRNRAVAPRLKRLVKFDPSGVPGFRTSRFGFERDRMLDDDTATPVNPNSINVEMSSELSAQQLYTSVAAAAKMGRPVAHLLRGSPLPTCHLTTTSDTLRQYHIHLRLWARPLGVGPPKMFGEAWIPFFKLYDADVVDVAHQYFYDATFCETLWQEGRSVGRLEGLLVFQNSPLIRQMMTGVQTELGFSRIAMPILGELTEYESARRHLPRELLQLSKHQEKLTDSLFIQSAIKGSQLARKTLVHLKSPSALYEEVDLQSICESILKLLSGGDPLGCRTAFVYRDLSGLVTGQRVLLELAKHLLDSIDSVPWHIRGIYGSMLSVLMRRGELDMGNLLPRIPECAEKFGDVELRSLTRLARRSEREVTAQTRSNVQSQNGVDEECPSPQSVKSPMKRLNVFAKLRSRPTRVRLRITRRSLTKQLSREMSHLPLSSLSSRSTDTQDLDTLAEDVSIFSTPLQRGNSNSVSREGSPDEGLSWKASPYTEEVVSLNPDEIQDLVTYHKRLKVAKLYLVTLLRLQHYSLGRLCSEALFESQRRHVCLFLALLYIRLPNFREQFLTHVLTAEERAAILPGWREHDFALTHTSLDEHDRWSTRAFPGLYELQIAFDWGPLHTAVQDYFGGYPRFVLDVAQSQSVEGWESKLCRPRGILFFSFLENWARVIWHTVQSQRKVPGDTSRASSASITIRWDLLPGYATLLKAFLIEMRTRPITKYPDALLNCSGALLANDKLLSVFFRIVLSRTSVFSREQTFAVFNYLDFWLEVLSVMGKPLPLTFDYRFLGKAIDTVLTSDLALQTAKALWFLYKRIDQIGSERLLASLIDLLIYRRFHDLFLNWSWLVRKCFYSLILYRVCEAARRVVAQQGGTNGVNGSSPNQPSTEDRLYCWAYVLLIRNLETLQLPAIFPSKFLEYHIRQVLHQPEDPLASPCVDSSAEAIPSYLIWSIPRVLVAQPRDSHTRTIDISPSRRLQTPKPAGRQAQTANENRVAFVHTKSSSSSRVDATLSRTAWAYRQSLRRLRRRKSVRERDKLDDEEPLFISAVSAHHGNPDRTPGAEQGFLSPDDEASEHGSSFSDPAHFLPPPMTIEKRHKPYLKSAAREFERELSSYKIWVISRSQEVPPMHIPASPLDTNVDVPLDDE